MTGAKMRMLALKFAYDGTKFDGFARQPKGKTVEGEIISALRAVGIGANPLSSSRTDKWVSARGNVLAIETDFPREKIIAALNGCLEHIWFYALADAPSRFKPRHAEWRKYRYYLQDDNFDLAKMKKCASILVGEHNFSALAKLEEGKNPMRKVMSLSVKKSGAFLEIDVKAQSFLWSMVRGIVGVLRAAGKGEINEENMRRILAGERRFDVGYAAPENLVLLEVRHKGLRFETDGNALKKMRREIDGETERIALRRKVIVALKIHR
ncbi:MAG: tRNA pseudouridine(38-40) synthase TruA [Thermoplasmata archaeon HGW-Thermoplasmata-2]|nr:MAG: tRNA pseudouridine(38-40) synthase TruA [Thermoplasmata archaeon HGW-Thermoplasmata-2]